jgi:hypothetical protein
MANKEPDKDRHLIFDSYEEAMEAWSALTPEQQKTTEGPRQAVPDLWIFNKPSGV